MSDVVDFRRKQRRLNININRQTEEALLDYSSRNQVTVTEAVRRHVGVAAFLLSAMEDGTKVLLRRGGEIDKVVFEL